MTTNFFSKNAFGYLALGLSLAVTLGCMGYASSLSTVETVALDTGFYYLVTDDTHVEAGAEFVRLEGGAGYLLEQNGREYVALTVFLSEKEGRIVQATLEMQNKPTQLIKTAQSKLYLKTTLDKEKSALYKGAFDSLQGCITVLKDCTERLEKGMTQEQCKRILGALLRQFTYLGKAYQTDFSAFSIVCTNTAQTLSAIINDTVYLKDLRYLLCQTAGDYVALAKVFSL